ncbi:MAG: HrpA-like RNA helicase, partial [Bacillariaceae sp.]
PTTTTTTKIGNKLKQDFIKKQSTKAYIEMLNQRKHLPMTSYRKEVLNTIMKHQVTILCAETVCKYI